MRKFCVELKPAPVAFVELCGEPPRSFAAATIPNTSANQSAAIHHAVHSAIAIVPRNSPQMRVHHGTRKRNAVSLNVADAIAPPPPRLL